MFLQEKKKNLSFFVKNSGLVNLTNCSLIVKGKSASWIYENNSQNISIGNEVKFELKINVPDNAPVSIYQGNLEVYCSEENLSQDFNISVIKSLDSIRIKDIQRVDNGLNLSYSFDPSDYIGESISVDIWLVDGNNQTNEIRRIRDNFPISDNRIVERNVFMNVSKNVLGSYDVYFALTSDLNEFAKKSIVLSNNISRGGSFGTGMVILDDSGSKNIGYAIFVLVVLVGVFFIVKAYWNDAPHDSGAEPIPEN